MKRIVSVFLILTFVVGIFAMSAVTTSAANKPSAPTVTLSNKSNGIRVDWNKVAGAREYIVYYKDNARGNWNKYYTGNNYFAYTRTESGKYYYFQVQPIGNNGVRGAYSKVKSLMYLSRPAFNKNTYVDTIYVLRLAQGKLAWNKVKGANYYEVVRYCYTTNKWERLYLGKNNYYNVKMVFKNFFLPNKPLRFCVRAIYSTHSGTARSCWSKEYKVNWT